MGAKSCQKPNDFGGQFFKTCLLQQPASERRPPGKDVGKPVIGARREARQRYHARVGPLARPTTLAEKQHDLPAHTSIHGTEGTSWRSDFAFVWSEQTLQGYRAFRVPLLLVATARRNPSKRHLSITVASLLGSTTNDAYADGRALRKQAQNPRTAGIYFASRPCRLQL